MEIKFEKYQALGNDFIMLNKDYNLTEDQIKHLCLRHFGIGADGLIIVLNSAENGLNFSMKYFNSDGKTASMCGNGARSACVYAKTLGLIDSSEGAFLADDGIHRMFFKPDKVSVEIANVETIEQTDKYSFLNTGVPHYVEIVHNLDKVDIDALARPIRHSITGGTNVNFVEIISPDSFKVRTYERGVEGETFACGTGATACSIALYNRGLLTPKTLNAHTRGGILTISFEKLSENSYKNIFLEAEAKKVFKGKIII